MFAASVECAEAEARKLVGRLLHMLHGCWNTVCSCTRCVFGFCSLVLLCLSHNHMCLPTYAPPVMFKVVGLVALEAYAGRWYGQIGMYKTISSGLGMGCAEHAPLRQSPKILHAHIHSK